MEFTAQREVAVPVEFAFAQATQFRRYANEARRSGARVRRIEPDEEHGRKLGWDVTFTFQGMERRVLLELAERVRPERFRIAIGSASLEGDLVVRFAPLGPGRCRVVVAVALAPRTLKARLVMQTLRLAMPRFERRFHDRLTAAVARLEAEWAADGAAP